MPGKDAIRTRRSFVCGSECGWFNCRQGWGTYIVLTAVNMLLLMLSVLRRFGTQGVELSPRLPERELARVEVEEFLKPKIS